MRQGRIAIIGAGPGGLILARILHMHGIDFVVYEREAFGKVRPQGGSLDMHADSGQYALKCANLFDEFQNIARYEDQEGRVYNKDAQLLFLDDQVAGKDRPEVDRGHLRELLLNSIPSELIHWNHELKEAKSNDCTSANNFEANNFEANSIETNNIETKDIVTKDIELVFQNGAREKVDLVVGADGAWSRVRPLVSQAKPIYSGVCFVELGIDNADREHPALASLIGRGLTFALGDSKAIIGHRNANEHIGVYVALRAAEDWFKSDDFAKASNDARKSMIAAHFEGWSKELLALIYQSGDRMTARGIYALPVGHTWKHRCGITLLGDAAHLMSPFGGDGANLAMQDGAILGMALASNNDWETVLEQFESEMFARAKGPAAGAWDSICNVFSEDGLNHTLEQMNSHKNEWNEAIAQTTKLERTAKQSPV
jgi:2-polyprenyl-6-methoxyphenol hydroxylase-like FAD-dependent oxidoreductase